MNYLVIVEKGENNYSAYAPDVPGCVSAGETFEETVRLMTEALGYHLELMIESGETIPPSTCDAVRVEVNIAVSPS